ncbi:MAG: ABC transporter family substrate-binding protein [Rothia sp. (in: high G+C Gram-positive bacteria)]|uniref:ABC transporter family substrate-binding protein n=1 Tax=Rothia sp. (in: high G+C Gram-positive bacteria) TaxID=1885016 RepID=UPI0026E025AF|nr:ABC transporter family substrate-binding protein [Rothia sp. (in: high G+C Gram-positive bacteria)]MDO5750524.1 ABC transporter family substrate-binding protein [Rothia sp. (in: high G+C Gram-positive bacteria)]
MTTQMFNRRTVLGGTAALGAAGMLVACGKKSSSTEEKQVLGADSDIKNLYNINEKDPKTLKQGGELNLSIGGLGPDYNVRSTNGNSSYVLDVIAPVHAASVWITNFAGEYVLDKNFCLDFSETEENGKQILTYTMNPKANFNDGTPIDVDAFEATWQIQKSSDGDYKIAAVGFYDRVESVEAVGGDKRKVKVTMAEPAYPSTDLFTYFLHPKMKDPELFNNGFNNNLHDELGAGPFKVGKLDTSAKVLTLVPNEKWWGNKPRLDKIVFREMDPAASRAALKNGEIDALATSSSSTYMEINGTKGTETRKGQHLYAGGLNINPKRVEDQKVRKAIFVGTNRAALANIWFKGLPYEEKVPGSMILLPFSKNYRDNFPTAADNDRIKAAQKILEDAGYTKSGDYYQKDGKNAKATITIFGDTPASNAQAQTFVQNMKEIGIESGIDNQPLSAFSTVVASKSYDIAVSGYGVSQDPTAATKYFYSREDQDGVGTAEIDEMIKKMLLEKDNDKRAQLCNDIEKKHMEDVSTLGSVQNGPDFVVCKQKLANYGAFLFASTVWENVGWEE